jgi:hypothetical protein
MADAPEDALGFPPGAFARLDETDDALFYEPPRLVQHIDDGAIAALFRVRVVLVKPHGVGQVGAEFPQYPLHPLQDEIALAPAARSPEQRKTGRPCHSLRHAALEIERLMPGQEDPLPGLDGIGIGHRHAEQIDRFHLDARHLSLRPRIGSRHISGLTHRG